MSKSSQEKFAAKQTQQDKDYDTLLRWVDKYHEPVDYPTYREIRIVTRQIIDASRRWPHVFATPLWEDIVQALLAIKCRLTIYK